MIKLSLATNNLWAKKLVKDGVPLWLPLVVHHYDSAYAAKKIWNHWLPEGIKRVIEQGISGTGSIEQLAERLYIFLASVHDLGKATPVFQAKRVWPPCGDLDDQINDRLLLAGLPIKLQKEFTHAKKTPHALAAQMLLEKADCSRAVASIIGAHHGRPQNMNTVGSRGIDVYSMNYHLGAVGMNAWSTVQTELIAYALELAGFASVEELPKPGMASQVLLSGLLIMADWVASNESLFPYLALAANPDSIDREFYQKNAWSVLALPYPWEAGNTWMGGSIYGARFPFIKQPNALQESAIYVAESLDSPGIMIIEAPMGMGKTEAALACAEIAADKFKCGGLYFALPTQATTDGMFGRLLDWVKRLEDGGGPSVKLFHGKAQFNDEYQALKMFEGSTNVGVDEQAGIFVHEWFEGQKKSMLAGFVAGTIDHLLLSALKQKHVMLRHLGLAGKVVIIDECHAYDAYMSQYLSRALNWLGAYRVPVIVLSATLPAQKRRDLVNAYLNKDLLSATKSDPLGKGLKKHNSEPEPTWVQNRAYPLITFTDNGAVSQKAVPNTGVGHEVVLEYIGDEAIIDRMCELLSGGGCAGVVVNTVRRSQELAKRLRTAFGDEVVLLLHSRFLAPDRAEKERQLLRELGKPGPNTERPSLRIVVGTQVLEQSLDIDFDVLFSDICPADLLLQRIGRLHRHRRGRPASIKNPRCFVTGCEGDGYEAGTEAVYGKYLLMRTQALLPLVIKLPEDIPGLVQEVYDSSVPLSPVSPDYHEVEAAHLALIEDKEKRAKDFRLGPLWPGSTQNLVGWLDTDLSEQQGEAAVRDTDPSIEALLFQTKAAGSTHFLPWVEGGRELTLSEPPGSELAKLLARQRIRLPGILCKPWLIKQTIAELEKGTLDNFSEWQKSIWLKGELVLALDENLTISLCGYRLVYSRQDGLFHEKEGIIDE